MPAAIFLIKKSPEITCTNAAPRKYRHTEADNCLLPTNGLTKIIDNLNTPHPHSQGLPSMGPKPSKEKQCNYEIVDIYQWVG